MKRLAIIALLMLALGCRKESERPRIEVVIPISDAPGFTLYADDELALQVLASYVWAVRGNPDVTPGYKEYVEREWAKYLQWTADNRDKIKLP